MVPDESRLPCLSRAHTPAVEENCCATHRMVGVAPEKDRVAVAEPAAVALPAQMVVYQAVVVPLNAVPT